MAQQNRDIVVVGASAGGVQALQRLAAGLPQNFRAAVFVVMHLWPGGPSYLSSILARVARIPVADAVDGETIRTGRIYIAPRDLHLVLEPETVTVVHGPRENRARPAINPLFRSAAAAYRNRVIGVILTGTLDDGAAGLWAVKQCGGLAVVQSDPVFDQMPRNALEGVAVDHHVPLEEIPPLLDRLANESVEPQGAATVPTLVLRSNDAAQMKSTGINLDDLGRRSLFSCPECNGALWELREGVLQYRCHVGHAYSGESLKDAQGNVIEASLWTALRALKESVALDERLAQRAHEHGLDKAAENYRQGAAAKGEHVEHLERFLESLRPRENGNGDV